MSEVFRGLTGRKYVAITFDAGGGVGNVPLLLNTLRAHGIHLTFFLTGRWVSENPTYAQQIVADGNEIANHTFDHLDLTKLSDAAVRREISTAEATITSITGVNPRPLFRSPYGAENKHSISIIQSMGYRPIFWSLDTLDSVGQPKSVEFLVERVKNQSNAALDGGIILMHVGLDTSAQAIGPILDNLTVRGFTVVTISRLIG